MFRFAAYKQIDVKLQTGTRTQRHGILTDGVTLIKSLKALVFATLFKSCLEKLSLVVALKLQI